MIKVSVSFDVNFNVDSALFDRSVTDKQQILTLNSGHTTNRLFTVICPGIRHSISDVGMGRPCNIVAIDNALPDGIPDQLGAIV
jgi:hypothetical protein